VLLLADNRAGLRETRCKTAFNLFLTRKR